jgi:hypothetical protein
MNNQPLYRNNLLDKPAELRKEIKRKIPVPIPLQDYKTMGFSTPNAVNPAEVQVCYIPPHQRPLDSSRISKFSKYQDKKHLPFSFNA